MTAPNAPSVRDVALDAAVRQHFDARHAAGLSVPYEQISERSRRIVRDQLRGTVEAVLEAVAPASWRATRGDCLATRHFPRIPGHRGGDAVCQRAEGHRGAHEGVVGRTAYCWDAT